MNREQAKALLPIITAFAEGKVIQYRYKKPDYAWAETTCPSWDVKSYEYRIKPEPRSLWAVYAGETMVAGPCTTRVWADNYVQQHKTTFVNYKAFPTRIVEFVEKMD